MHRVKVTAFQHDFPGHIISVTQELLVLVDGSYTLFRAYHAMPGLSTGDGQPTGAILGSLNILRKAQADYQPHYLAVVFDSPEPGARAELYPGYKANRPPIPGELAAQIEPLQAIIKAQGTTLLHSGRAEADDVIATLAQRADKQGLRVYILSGDKDLAQLVNERITLIPPLAANLLDAAGVEKKYGVPPALIGDWLALVGDSSDNIPGVPLVGPKTASRWLNHYGGLQQLLEQADELKGKAGENLRAGREQLALARRLVTLDCDLALDCKLPDLKSQPPDWERLREYFRKWEFRSFLAELERQASSCPEPDAPPSGPTEAEAHRAGYEVLLSDETWRRWLEKLRAAELLSLKLETTGPDYMCAELAGISFAIAPGEAAYLPLAHAYPDAPPQLDRKQVLAELRPLLEDERIPKLGHNLKYDRHVLSRYGIELRGIRHDSMLESYVLNSTAAHHDLDSMALLYLGRKTLRYEDVAGKGAKQMRFEQVALEQAAPYAAEHADCSLCLHRTLFPRLRATPHLERLYQELEMPLLPVLGCMERIGVLVDRERLDAESRKLEENMGALERRARELAGRDFNPGSTKQLREILYEHLLLPIQMRTPKGEPSTAEDALRDLAQLHELPAVLLEHRALSKLKNTYTDRLPEQIHTATGRLHTSYHQAVTATGRLSSAEPNLQNIPARTEAGRRIRAAFVAPPGSRIVTADYSQVELRIMAHLSGDTALRRAFAAGEDVHRATAAEIFQVAPEQVRTDQRRGAKAINFGLIYGMSPFGLARQLGIPRADAQSYVERYFERYSRVREFMERTRQEARVLGYVETVFKRRLYLPELQSKNAARRRGAERRAVNAPMQGSAADLIKRAMLNVDRWLREHCPEARMIMQVHDELVFEAPEEQAEWLGEQVGRLMSDAAELTVPLRVDTGVGDNWEEAH